MNMSLNATSAGEMGRECDFFSRRERRGRRERMDIMEDVKKLLGGVSNIIQKIAQYERGERFNVFSLCGVNHYEVWHSKILAEFLNPHGSHGQKDLFLKLFASRFLDKPEKEFSDATTVSTEVTSYIKDLRIGRFDILIEDTKNKRVCIIENKIFAGEQPEQLRRYSDWLHIERNSWETFLLFLTLDGHVSTTIMDKQKYKRLAYWSKDNNDNSIASWIGTCAKTIEGKQELQHLCSTLEQYKIHIENIAKGEKAMNDKIVDTIIHDMASAQAIFDNYRDACLTCANDILINQVLSKLNSNIKKDEDPWAVEGSCNFNKGQEGVLFFRKSNDPMGKEVVHGHIFVIFGATHLSQCQVAIWQNCKDGNNLIKLEEGKDDKIVNELKDNCWSVTYGNVNWPVWRGVKDPNDNSGSSYLGMDWNGEFFDKMKSDKDYSEKVINDIVKSILTLYKFQKEYEKLHPLS